jgi:ADP-heptose:LPS heptosyltransferase
MQIERDARTLRLLNASDAIVLRDDAWWAAALARAAVPGLVVTAVDERNRPFATTLVDLQSHTHNTARAAALATALFAEELPIGDLVNWDMSPRISVEEQSAEEARALLRELGIDGRYIVIHPGAGSPVKTWPVRFWRAVIGSLDGHRIVVTGSQAEALDCAAIAAGFASTVSIAGQTSLETLLGLLHGSSLAVGTDNGPLHLAAAAGTPTIRLFGPSDPRRYGPPAGSSIHKIIEAGWSCPRCGDLSLTRAAGCGCMLAITPTAVVNSIRKALSDGP